MLYILNIKSCKILHPSFYLCKMVVKNNISLKPFNTFGVDAKARYFAEIVSVSDLQKALSFAKEKKIPLLILGGGSNVLFAGDFEGLVLLNRMQGMEAVKETDESVWLKVMGGQQWPGWVDYCVTKGLGGIENLSLIPGTVGAAPIQNIGAYGVEVKEVIDKVEAFNLETGEIRVFSNSECEFDYRSSVFKKSAKGRYFVLSVTFKLSKNPAVNINYAPLKNRFEGRDSESISVLEVSDAVKQIRRSKLPDPEELGNAGSFFKNPVIKNGRLQTLLETYPEMPHYPFDKESSKLAAGWLIEQCGWKGKRVGDAGVHDNQALVMVNHGDASGEEVLSLAEKVRQSVDEKFGVRLEFEVNIV